MSHEELDFILPERQGDSPALGGDRAYDPPPPDPDPDPTPGAEAPPPQVDELEQLLDELIGAAVQAIEQHLPATLAAFDGILDAFLNPRPPADPPS